MMPLVFMVSIVILAIYLSSVYERLDIFLDEPIFSRSQIMNPEIYAKNLSKEEIDRMIMILSHLSSGSFVYVYSIPKHIYATMCSEDLLDVYGSVCWGRRSKDVQKILKSWMKYKMNSI